MGLKKKLIKKIKRNSFTRRIWDNYHDRKSLEAYLATNPNLEWQIEARAPFRAVEVARAQIGSKLFLFGGYMSMAKVNPHYYVFDMESKSWECGGLTPEGMAETHHGVVTDDERYIYIISGQKGAQCSPNTAACFVFDSQTRTFSEFPSLPEGRYMPMVVMYNGRIHSLGGGAADRFECTTSHWSIGVEDGKATEGRWREEAPIPSSRTHAACVLDGSTLFAFSGQRGDVKPFPDATDYKCDFGTMGEVMLDSCFSMDLDSGEIKDLASIPYPVAHIEHSIYRFGNKVAIYGGTMERTITTGNILVYDLVEDEWEEFGRLPYRAKSQVIGAWDGRVYAITGQKEISPQDPCPSEVLDSVWSMPESVFEESSK